MNNDDDGAVYRQAKEAFVSGLSGSSVHRINAVSFIALTSYALWAVLRTRFPAVVVTSSASGAAATAFPASLALETAVVVLPILLANTVLANAPLTLNLTALIAVAALLTRFPQQDRLAYKYAWHLFGTVNSVRRPSKAGKGKISNSRNSNGKRHHDLGSSTSPTAYTRDDDDSTEDPDEHEDDYLLYDHKEEDEDKLRGVSSTASVSGQESRRSISLRHRRNRSSGTFTISTSSSPSRAAYAAAQEDLLSSDGSGQAVSSAFRLAREGVAPSPVSQAALAAFQELHRQQLQLRQQANAQSGQRSSATEASDLFTPIPASSTSASGPSAIARQSQWTPSPLATELPRGKRRHTRHWSKAYLESDNDDDEDRIDALGTVDIDEASAASPQGQAALAAESSGSGEMRRTSLEAVREEGSSSRDSAPSSRANAYRIPSPGRHAANHEEFSVSVDPGSTANSHQPMPEASSLQSDTSTAEWAARIAMPVRPFLTIYRAHMMLMTIICILAVDFAVFPRAFAKCETWGTSLMDMGVGSFVFSLGLISAGPHLRRSIIQAIQQRRQITHASSPSHSLAKQLTQDLRRSLPILVLGIVRVLLVKSTEYPEHVSEYGVHWNFFVTLGLLPVTGTLVRAGFLETLGAGSSRRSRKKGEGVTGARLGAGAGQARLIGFALTLASVFQLLLWLTPLQAWAISNDPALRAKSLIGANKEGLTSFPGYLVLYLLGMDLGGYVLPTDPYLAHRLRAKRQLRSRRERLDGGASGREGGIVDLAAPKRSSSEQHHTRSPSLASISVSSPSGAPDARGRTSNESTVAGLPSPPYAPSHLAQGHQRSHGSTTSISSLAGGVGASPLHVHVLRHRPNGSLSRLSTSSDGLDSIMHAASGQLHNGEPGQGGKGLAGVSMRAPRSHSDKLAMVLFSFASVWWGVYLLLWLCGAQPSRRIANVMYIVWVAAYNTSFILGYLLIHMCLLEPLERTNIERANRSAVAAAVTIEHGSEGHGQLSMAKAKAAESTLVQRQGTTPLLLESLNRHSLVVFLVANVLTGLVNLSMRTMYASDTVAVIVLTLYLVACFGTALALDRARFRLRL